MQGTGGRCLIFLKPNILINPVFFKSVKRLHEKQCLTPKPRWLTERKGRRTLPWATKEKQKEKGNRPYRPTGEKGWQGRISNTPYQVKNKFKKKSKVGRPLGRRKEPKDKQNWRQNNLQLGKLEKGEGGSFYLPVFRSSLLFPFPDYYSSASFFSLMLSSEKLPSFLPSFPMLLRPSSFALVPHRLGGHRPPACWQWRMAVRHTMADAGVSSALQLAFERKNQSQHLTWGRLI